MGFDSFHPAVRNWFAETFELPTEVQRQAWRAISARQHTLIAAPTGSGKTLAAFLAVIDDLVKLALQQGLRDETTILYVSPLKALSNDIHKNLEEPLNGISDHLQRHGFENIEIRSAVRSGDTSQYEREQMRRRPPNILVTTPESLFILLTSDSGRDMLSTVRTVIVDEIHAVIGNKRGSHLALSLERLQHLCNTNVTRIGLSATQKPIDDVADFLVGNRKAERTIIDHGYERERDLALIVPESPLTAVMSMDGWQQIYDRLAGLINEHHTTLIFVNTRRLAERAARFLADRLGEDAVTAHHGSLAKEHRLRAEQRLKNGELKALVATASLELGIDIGEIDLVCQLGSPRSIAAFLQRIGRSGHRIGALPKGRLFPLTRDDLVECTALLHAIHQGDLDTLSIPRGHHDVLAQHIVAEVGCGEWSEPDLFKLIKSSWSYRELDEHDFRKIVTMLVEGYTTRRGPRSRYLFRDAVNRILKPRKGAKLAAVTNAGAIPDQFDYDVILEPEGHFVGTLNEDFAFESLAGDIFQLGNTSYRILQVSQGKVRVADANGQPPNIPFWFGEAPGRSDELSRSVSKLRQLVSDKLDDSVQVAVDWLKAETGTDDHAARQLVDYLALSRAALGCLPTCERIILERFFDDNGDQHLVVHSPYGSRVNRAWGLALRKRFCRQFNFELQAAALDDYIVLSLGATHSFPLEDIRHYLKPATVREVLVQAMLAAPMFATHWRWNASVALAIKRFHNGKRTPAPFQRADAEDLMALVFPDQLACQENLAGEREVPEHPLVQQTVNDCLHDIMDIETLESVLAGIEQNSIEVLCRDLSAPSPMAEEILNARPYAFLDDAPAEERRTRAVSTQNILDINDASDLGKLDADAINRVRSEAWPAMENIDELHDAMYQLGFLKPSDISPDNRTRTEQLLTELTDQKRAARVQVGDLEFWVCTERMSGFLCAWPEAVLKNEIAAIEKNIDNQVTDRESALRDLLRSRMTGLALI
ncbi:MAG: DEAD/DEAH box helicase, partial [Gammaproteobacteria bacterium]|nr:DEAD/DEAH box helicase [Gammaproteobacteria bacterium]